MSGRRRFSNRPFRVKHFQTIRRCSVRRVELSWHVGFTPDFGRMVAMQELTLRASNGLMRRSKKAQSLDNLVGSHKQGWRHRKPKRLRSFEIDDHQILCWQLDGEF